eukprot:1089167-Pyramimonas_sp.AAC.1
MCEFVSKWSGGDDPMYLKQLFMFSSTLLHCRRDLPPSLFKVLSCLDWAGGPNYVFALVKASLRAPDNHTRDGNVSKLFMGVDIQTITSTNRGKCVEAQLMMEKARGFLDSLVVDASVKDRLVSELEIRCVHHIHKKKSRDLVEFKSLQAIQTQFMLDVMEAVPFVASMPPTSYPFRVTVPKEHNSTIGPSIRQFTATGVDAGELSKNGFVVGSVITRKAPQDGEKDATYTIMSIGETVDIMPAAAPQSKKRSKKQSNDDSEQMGFTVAAILDDFEETDFHHQEEEGEIFVVPHPPPAYLGRRMRRMA